MTQNRLYNISTQYMEQDYAALYMHIRDFCLILDNSKHVVYVQMCNCLHNNYEPGISIVSLSILVQEIIHHLCPIASFDLLPEQWRLLELETIENVRHA